MQVHHKKIIFSTYDELNNPYYGGGGAIAIHEIARRLSKHFNITIFCGKYPGYRDYIYQHVTYKHIGIPVANGKIGQLLFQILLPFFVTNNYFDLWVESFTPPFSTAFLPLFTKKPLIGLVHMLSGEDMKRKYKIPFNIIESLGLSCYKNFIVLTTSDRKKIKSFNTNATIQVIPNGIRESKRIKKIAKRKHILYIGRIEINQKGIDLLLYAYQQISLIESYPLIIAGDGNNKEVIKLRMLIQKLHLNHKVKLLGKVKHHEKENLYQKAICVVIPSRFESFSLVALESLSKGRAIITFSIAGLSWIPDSYRIIVNTMKANDLKMAILDIIHNTSKREKIEKSSPQFAQKFNWRNISKKYKYYFNHVISKEN